MKTGEHNHYQNYITNFNISHFFVVSDYSVKITQVVTRSYLLKLLLKIKLQNLCITYIKTRGE